MIAQTSDPNPIVQLLPLLLLVAVFYFLLIRPQQRRMRQQRSLIASLDVGDEVLTIGGMFGTITGVDDEAFDVEISPGTRVRLLKSAVARRVVDEPVTPDEEASEES
ncbi:MAG: preprotein translocase subunit YajC [Actinomycetota bacterium]